MSPINHIPIPLEEGSQLPISDSLTSPDSGITASSKAAYDLNNKIVAVTEEVHDSIETIQNDINNTINTEITSIKNSISNVNNTADANKHVASARQLTTPRNIGGVAFDGSKDISLPGVNLPGNQDTTGNADTATKLANLVKIGGVDFDGSQNINLPGVNVAGNQSTSGNAATASRATMADVWTTTRTLTLIGKASGAVNIRGDGNVSLNVTSVAYCTYCTFCTHCSFCQCGGDCGDSGP